jgi:hypothetical protein
MIERKDMMELMFRVMCPSGSGYPGAMLSNAEEIILGLCVAVYMAEDSDVSISMDTLHDILNGKWEDMDEMKVGRAFGAALQVNQGNKYALNVIVSTLQGYNGKEIPGGIAGLLNILEGYVSIREKETETEH